MVIRGKTVLLGTALAVALVVVLVMSSDSRGDNSHADDVRSSLDAVRGAEERYFDKHSRYTDLIPELQLAGGAAVSGSLTAPVDREIEIARSGRMVTVTIHSLEGDDIGWFSLLNGSEYGVGGLAAPTSR